MITRFTLQFEGCFTLTDTDLRKIVDVLNDRYQGGTFRIDAQSVKRDECWCERGCCRCGRD